MPVYSQWWALRARCASQATASCRRRSALSSLLSEGVAYKCAHAATDDEVAARCKGGEWCDYERALRYNLAAEERTALVELIFLLKGLHAALHGLTGDDELLMRRGLHEITQAFVHTTMGGATRKAVKYEKKALKAALMNLRNMCADWAAGQSLGSMMDEDSIKSKAFKSSDHRDDYPDRAVPPSQTQLWLMRATARSLYDERSAHIKGTMLQEADLPKETALEVLPTELEEVGSMLEPGELSEAGPHSQHKNFE